MNSQLNRESANEAYTSDNIIHQQAAVDISNNPSKVINNSTVIIKNNKINSSVTISAPNQECISNNKNKNNENLGKIPDHFIKTGCLSWSCENFDYSLCLGCKQSYNCICIEVDNLCCKIINEDSKTCFICFSGKCEAFNPIQIWKWYLQMLCFECFCSIPTTGLEETYRIAPVALTNIYVSEIIGDVVLCLGSCCCNSSCNFNIPTCIGFYRKGACICFEMEESLCKLLCWEDKRINKNTCCLLYQCNCLLVQPYTCCKGISQICCIDSRCAFPCDNEIPCVYTLFPFCSCFVQGKLYMACCQTINDLVIAVSNNTNNSQNIQFINNQTIITLVQQPSSSTTISTIETLTKQTENIE